MDQLSIQDFRFIWYARKISITYVVHSEEYSFERPSMTQAKDEWNRTHARRNASCDLSWVVDLGYRGRLATYNPKPERCGYTPTEMRFD